MQIVDLTSDDSVLPAPATIPLQANIPIYIPSNLYPNHESRKRPRVAFAGRSSFPGFNVRKRPTSDSTIVKCCSCDLSNDAEYVHPVLQLPICGRCHKMYADASFTVDSETGNCWECLMCGVGDGNWMFMCDQCPHSFCQRCVEFSVGKKEAERVRALEEWQCFACAPTPAFLKHAVSKDFAFFNIESVYKAIRPPKDQSITADSNRGVRDRWSGPLFDAVVPQQVVQDLSAGERRLASLFSAQMINSVMPLLRIPDAFLAAKDYASLKVLSKGMRQFFRWVVVTPGLFRTSFGQENDCKLHPHQNVSLRWMTQAENYTDQFGALRGGIIADAPGLGKTVTVLALVASTAGQMPMEPAAFWDTRALEEVWAEAGGSSEGNFRRVENALRETIKHSQLAFYPPQLTAEHFHKRFQVGHFPTLASFERAVREQIRVLCVGHHRHGEILRHSFRRNMLAAKASMDRRARAAFQSPGGIRMLLERSLHPSACTLIVVPMALLEHWFEQIRRHLGLDYVAHSTATFAEQSEFKKNGVANYVRGGTDEDTLRGRRGVVYFDGLGDILDVEAPLPRLRLGGERKSAIDLAQYLIVVTTFERCASLQQQAKQQQERQGALGLSARAVGAMEDSALELAKIRWLRLVVDEGHELGAGVVGSETDDAIAPATTFIRDLAAERRWVMSGTPTTGTTSSAALQQIQRLLVFLRHQEWGVGSDAASQWQRLVAKPFLKQDPVARELLETTLRQVMIRHVKQDLRLFEPIRNTVILDENSSKASLASTSENLNTAQKIAAEMDELDDNKIDKIKAKYIHTMIQAANSEWHHAIRKMKALTDAGESGLRSVSQLLAQERSLRRPKAIVFSTDKAHLAGVGHFLYLWMGDRGVCEHSGADDETVGANARRHVSEMRSAELSRFRTSKRKYRLCPLCGGENFITGGPNCTKTLLLVEYDPQEMLDAAAAENEPRIPTIPASMIPMGSAWAQAPSSGFLATRPARLGHNYALATIASSRDSAETLPPAPAAGGHGASGPGSFYFGECLCSAEGCKARGVAAGLCQGMPNPFMFNQTRKCFVDNEIQSHSGHLQGRHLALVAEEHIRHWIPGRRFVPNERVYVQPAAATTEDEGVSPILWRGGRMGGFAHVRAWKRCGKGSGQSGWHGGQHILKTAPWVIEDEDASVLLLQEDGSTGLDLSFATHIFLLNQLRDPALESQIISRAHRMGAKGPVNVTLVLANEVEEKEMSAMSMTAAAVKSRKRHHKGD